MSTTMRIHVTKDIINKAKYCGENKTEIISESCAIALAVRDLFPEVRVTDYSIQFGRNGYIYATSYLPFEAREFITKFDETTVEQREQMSPISFNIEVPDKVIDKISIEEIERILENSETIELV